jgi:hypothetical protein
MKFCVIFTLKPDNDRTEHQFYELNIFIQIKGILHSKAGFH